MADLGTVSQISADISSIEREIEAIDVEIAVAVEDWFFLEAMHPSAVKAQESLLASLRGRYFEFVDELAQLLCKRDEMERAG